MGEMCMGKTWKWKVVRKIDLGCPGVQENSHYKNFLKKIINNNNVRKFWKSGHGHGHVDTWESINGYKQSR